MGDEGQVGKTMRAMFLKKCVTAAFAMMFMCSCGGDEQKFVAADTLFPDDMSEKRIQKARDEIMETEVYLLFSDDDVRMTIKPKGDKVGAMILQKIGDDLYRGKDEHNVFDLELNTLLGHIKSCKLTVYKEYSGSSMEWKGTVIFKRK